MSRDMYVRMIEVVDREFEKLKKQREMLQSALLLESGESVDVTPIISAPNKTFMEMAREVLADKEVNPSQTPLHARKIGEAVQIKFKKPVDFKSLSQMLFANARVAKKKSFYKDKNATNTYGLVEWQK